MAAAINAQMLQNIPPQAALAACICCPCITGCAAGVSALMGAALGAIAMAAAGSIGASTGAVFVMTLMPVSFILDGIPGMFILGAVLQGKISLNSGKIRLLIHAVVTTVAIVFVMLHLLPSLGYPITLSEVLFLYAPFFLCKLCGIPRNIAMLGNLRERQRLADLAAAAAAQQQENGAEGAEQEGEVLIGAENDPGSFQGFFNQVMQEAMRQQGIAPGGPLIPNPPDE